MRYLSAFLVNEMLEHCNTQPQNEQCEGASIRGLSFTNKVNEFENEPFNPRLLNRVTGEVLEITPEIKHKFRLSRMQRRVYAWANAMKSIGGLKGGFRYRQVMITLTYAPAVKWSPNQIKDFMSGLKRVLGDKLLAYAWVAEMQERGVPHYHVFCVVKKGTKIPMPDKPYGQRGHVLWPFGMTKIETAKTPYYLVKYTGKEHQKEGFYKGMRIFAVWIAKGLLSELEARIFRVSGLPKWLAREVLMFLTRIFNEIVRCFSGFYFGHTVRPKHMPPLPERLIGHRYFSSLFYDTKHMVMGNATFLHFRNPSVS